MLKTYNYHCPNCEEDATRLVRDEWKDTVICVNCASVMERRPSAPAFFVRGGTPKFHNHGAK